MSAAKEAAQNFVVSLTTEQLGEILEQASARALAKVISQQHAEVLDIGECAALLKCTRKTVSKYVATRGLPCHYISPQDPRFRRSEVLTWLSEQTAVRAAAREGT